VAAIHCFCCCCFVFVVGDKRIVFFRSGSAALDNAAPLPSLSYPGFQVLSVADPLSTRGEDERAKGRSCGGRQVEPSAWNERRK